MSSAPFVLRTWLDSSRADAARLARIAATLGAALVLSACSGHPLASASSEPGCAACSVFAESDSPFVDLQGHDDELFLLDQRGAISSLSKAGGELVPVVPAFSGAVACGVSATALAWVAPSELNGTPTNHIHALLRGGSPGPELADFTGAPALALGLGAAFVGAFSDATTGSQVVRYSLSDGTASSPSETLSDEETNELPSVAGSDADVVWCRAHADSSSSLWRLGASGDPAETSLAFSCAKLWTLGDGRVFVLDASSGNNCYYLVDAAGNSTMTLCTSGTYEHFTPLADGSVAFVDSGAAVRRVDTDSHVTALFQASSLVGIQSAGSLIYYATVNHVGSFALGALP